jgi:hypothetical protein
VKIIDLDAHFKSIGGHLNDGDDIVGFFDDCGMSADYLRKVGEKAPCWAPSGDNAPVMPLTLDDWAARNIPPSDCICGSWLTTTYSTTSCL